MQQGSAPQLVGGVAQVDLNDMHLGVGRKDARAIIILLEGLLLQRLYDGGRTRFKDQAPYVEALLKIGGST